MVRSARVLLREPSRPAVHAAITGASETLDLLRRTLPALTRDCRDPALQAELAEADTMAVRAIEEYRVALREDLLPRATLPRPLGREKLASLLLSAEAETASPESLLARAEREIIDRRARLGALADRIVPGGDVRGALAALVRDEVPEGQLPATISGELDTLRARLRAKNLVTLPPSKLFEVRWTLAPGRDRPAVRLIAPGPFETAKRRTRLVYESAGAVTSANGLDSRRALLHRAALPWALIREALPGRWPLEVARRTTTRVRQAFPAASATEGWCAYAEALAIEQEISNPVRAPSSSPSIARSSASRVRPPHSRSTSAAPPTKKKPRGSPSGRCCRARWPHARRERADRSGAGDRAGAGRMADPRAARTAPRAHGRPLFAARLSRRAARGGSTAAAARRSPYPSERLEPSSTTR